MDVKLEPLRGLDDFLLNSARFQVPDVRDLDRWNKRVKENLIYYQTNYFLTATIIFLIVGVLHPSEMLLGIIAMSGAYLLCSYALKNQTVMDNLRKKYPLPTLLLILAVGYLFVSVVSSVLVVFFGLLLPVVVSFVHASLRLRDVKNRLSNIKEKLNIKTTPMGLILDELEMPFQGFTD